MIRAQIVDLDHRINSYFTQMPQIPNVGHFIYHQQYALPVSRVEWWFNKSGDNIGKWEAIIFIETETMDDDYE